VLRIRDEGNGFDHRHYQTRFAVDDAAPNGRGIAIASRYAFHQVDYLGRGNEVVATYFLAGGNEIRGRTDDDPVREAVSRRASS
jgi:hypothetical protein